MAFGKTNGIFVYNCQKQILIKKKKETKNQSESII